MIAVRRILIPIDFSEASREALRVAAALARWYRAHVTLMHAVSPVFMPGPLTIGPVLTTPAGVSDYALAHLENELRDWAIDAEIPPTECDVAVELGEPTALIVAASERFNDGLIVMGTHGRSGLRRFMLGSVTERVLRKAACPVLTVPPVAGTAPRIPFTSVLCAVDFSPESTAAAHYAVSIATLAEASMTLLHVVDWPVEVGPIADRDPAVIAMRRRREVDGWKALDAFAASQDIPRWVSSRIDCGEPSERILSIAAAERADLIVLGTHTHSVFERAFRGSTTDYVVRRAPCPVLTLRGVAVREGRAAQEREGELVFAN